MIFRMHNCCPIVRDVTPTPCISRRKKALLPDHLFLCNPSLRTWYLGTVVHFQFLIVLVSLLAVLSFRNKAQINGLGYQHVHVPI